MRIDNSKIAVIIDSSALLRKSFSNMVDTLEMNSPIQYHAPHLGHGLLNIFKGMLITRQLPVCTCQQKLDTKLKKLGIKIEYLYKMQ